MYQLNVKLTNKQRSLLADALYYYSESFTGDRSKNDSIINAVESLEDLIDENCQKVK